MKGDKKIAGMVLMILMSAMLFAEVNIPSEVDPSSGKMEFTVTLTTLTGRGFDLPIILTYNSGIWNRNHIFTGSNRVLQTWLKGPVPYGVGWSCNLGGRMFQTEVDDNEFSWFFVTNDNSVHPFARYNYYYMQGIEDWRTTDNTWIYIAQWNQFDSTYGSDATTPTLPNGVKFTNSTDNYWRGDLFADDGISGRRFEYIVDPNGNRPFHFCYDYVGDQQDYLLTKIEGITDTAVFFYTTDQNSYPAVIDSILIRSGTVLKRLVFYASMTSTNIPDSMGTSAVSTYLPPFSNGTSLPLLDSIKLNGEILYRFNYNGNSELDEVVNRAGGKKEYFYGSHHYWEADDEGDCEKCFARRVDSVKVWSRSGESYTWKYEETIESPYRNPYLVKVTTPAGGQVHFSIHSFHCDDTCGGARGRDGLVKEVKTFASTPSGDNYIYKTENGWATTSAGYGAYWNARVDTTTTTWRPTSGGSTAYQTSSRVEERDKYNNPESVLDNAEVGSQDWAYVTKYTYEDNSDYINKNMISLVKDAYTVYVSDTVYLSKTSYSYDEVACTTYTGSISGWVVPSNNYRGNLTQVTTYGASDVTYNFNCLGPGGASSTVKYRYDQFGHQIKSISYPSSGSPETTYTRYANSTPNPYVFPVRTVNYLSGGLVDSLSSRSVWDIHTGLVDTTWGFNGRWTAYTYDDFGRVLTVKNQGESSAGSRSHYYDEAQVPYQVDSVRLDASRWLVSRTYTDLFGATIQTHQIDNSGGKTLVSDYMSRLDSNLARASNTREVNQALSSYQTPTWSSLDYTITYYDVLGRDTLSIDQTGNKIWTQYGIDGSGGIPYSIVKVQNDSVNYWQSWTKTIQDKRGRTSVVYRGGKHGGSEVIDTTFYSYCYQNLPGSRLANVKNPKGDYTFYYYDRLGQLRGVNGPDVVEDTFYVTLDNDTHYVDLLFNYDGLGRVTEKSDPAGTLKTYYDEMGRTKRIRYRENGTSTYGTAVEMYYDSTANPEYARGKLVESMMYGVRIIRYDYDSLGRMTVKNTRMPFFSNWKTLKYIYNQAGLVTHLVYPAPDTGSAKDTVKYFYDNFGRIDSVPGFLDNVKYGSDGLIDTVFYRNGTYTVYSHNDRLALTQLKTRKTSDLVNLSYSYENNGLIHWIVDNRSGTYNQTYKYDYLGQLAKVSYSADSDTFRYDGAGNRTYRDNNQYIYSESTNKLTSAEGWSFSYDSCGNIVRQVNGSDRLFFEYDIFGRLTEFRNDSIIEEYDPFPGDTLVNYVYGGAAELRNRKRMRVCVDSLIRTRPYLKKEDAFGDLVLRGNTVQDVITDSCRDIGEVYFRNSTDTFYIAIFPRKYDGYMSYCKFKIAIDNDRVEGSGKARLPEDTMTLLQPGVWWEYCLYMDSPSSYGYYDTNGTKHSQPACANYSAKQRGDIIEHGGSDSGFVMTLLKDSIPLDSIIRVTVFSFKPGFTNTNEFVNGGSSASDVVPGGSDCMSEGVPNENEELYDPGSNDPNPGHAYTFKEFYRIYLYGKDDIAPLVEYSAPYGGEFDHVPVRYVYGIPGATIRITTRDSMGGRDTFFLHKDANGSVRSITNVSGTEVKCYHYDPFGNIVAVTGSDTGNTRNTRRYAGRDWDDETDLVYMVARFYDPRFGRFTSPDPEPTVMSPYTYVLNNPVSLTDPTGHAAKCGGAYQPNFSTQTWRLIMYGAFLWRQWPMPQEKNTIDPKVYIGGNWNGGAFVDASGLDPFRKMWQDPLGLEVLINLYHRMLAKFDLSGKGVPGMISSSDDIFFGGRALNSGQLDIFKRFLLISCLLSPELRGRIATTPYGDDKEISLKGIFEMVLANTPSEIKLVQGMFAGNTEAAKIVTDAGMYVLGFSSAREWNDNPANPPDPQETTNIGSVMNSFLHEMMHFATIAYDLEYTENSALVQGGTYASPTWHISPFRWWQ